MEYRSDLTGLRALAVVAVVFYHFGLPGFGGGFAGVDVFFVISGYLMTRIVLVGLAAGRFSFATFYLSRGKRIVPALAVVCLVLLLFGFLYLGKRDFYTLSKHVVSSALFLSNFAYRNEAGYFDADAHEKWLLHTWSLSVEWQFYLLYPLVLALIARFFPPSTRVFRGMLWLLAAISFAFCVVTTQSEPVDAFFLLPARAWELLAGGLVYVYSPRLGGLASNRLVELAGLALIGVSITALSAATHWPGYVAAMPVAGACLILLAAPRSFWIDNPVSQAIGQWSYSIYLWHWPIYVAARYFDWERAAWSSALQVLASVLLGYLSYRYVEEPCRHSAFASALIWRRLALMGMPVVLIGAVGIATKGLPQRLPEAVALIETDPAHLRGDPTALCSQKQNLHGLDACMVGNMAVPPSVAVLGDSHAGALMYAIKRTADASNIGVMALLSAACPPIAGIQGIAGIAGDGCRRYMVSSLAALDATESIKAVLFVARWSVYVEGYSEKNGGPYALFGDAGMPDSISRRLEYRRRLVDSLCNLSKHRKVYVMLPIPEQLRNIPREMVRRIMTGASGAPPAISRAAYAKRNDLVLSALDEASRTCGVLQLDPRPYLCDKESCMGVVDGRPVYYDDDHLNEYGSNLVAGVLLGVDEFTAHRSPK